MGLCFQILLNQQIVLDVFKQDHLLIDASLLGVLIDKVFVKFVFHLSLVRFLQSEIVHFLQEISNLLLNFFHQEELVDVNSFLQNMQKVIILVFENTDHLSDQNLDRLQKLGSFVFHVEFTVLHQLLNDL